MSTIAKDIIERLGGVRVVAEITGSNASTVHRWTYPHDRNGRGGFIPRWHHDALIEYAKQNSIPLEYADFVTPPAGREVA